MQPDCPPWTLPESDADVPSVASGLIEFQRFIYKNSKKHILQHGDLKTWHEKIFRDVVPVSYYAGHYRSDDCSRPCLRQDVQVSGLRGAPFPEVPRLMRKLSEEMRHSVMQIDEYLARGPNPINRARAVVELAALYCGKFLKIHPFLNCNGRMSRLISNYVLDRYGYPMPYYNPYPRPGIAYAQASAACMTGNFKPMFEYLLVLLGTGISV